MQYRLKTQSTHPPGGWQFRQKETHWMLPPGLSFRQAVQKIIEHRRANALDAKHKAAINAEKVANELEEFTIVRIGFNSSFVYSIDPEKKNSETPVTLHPFLENLKQKSASLVEKLKNSVSGIRVITEWWGDGGLPVDQEKAEARAIICETCPNNVTEGWWGRFTKPVAAKIKEHLRVKNQLEMKVANEEKLGICSACDCHLPLKLWCPTGFIAENTTPEVLEKLTPQCWIRTETQSASTYPAYEQTK